MLELPPHLRELVLALEGRFPENKIPSLRMALEEYVRDIVRSSQKSAFINVPLALRIKATAVNLLNRYGEVDAESQNWISMAIKYFLLRDDARNGFTLPDGFEDDALVMDAAQKAIQSKEAQAVKI